MLCFNLSVKIKESLRCAAIFPFVFPRRTICDTTIKGMPIKKGTVVVYEPWAVFADEKVSNLPKLFHV